MDEVWLRTPELGLPTGYLQVGLGFIAVLQSGFFVILTVISRRPETLALARCSPNPWETAPDLDEPQE